MKEELENKLYRDLADGKSIVSALVDIGIHAHRPFEAMTDQVLRINASFSRHVKNRAQLSEYLQDELTLAKKAYTRKLQQYL